MRRSGNNCGRSLTAMKSDIFYWLMNMSIYGGVLVLIVLLLRQIPGIPRRFVYALWVIPFLRLVIPFGIRGKYNLMMLLEQLGVRRVTVSVEVLENQPLSGDNFTGAAQTYFPVTYESNVLTQVFETAALVWAVMMAACVITAGVLYVCTRWELRSAQCCKNYYISEKVTAPILDGVFKPRILVPSHVPEGALEHILAHERVHIRRMDNLWRCLGILVCCVHWFNPLCWLGLKYFLADMELSCDEAVIHHMNSVQRKAYATALLDTAQQQTVFASAFGGAGVRLRIHRILSYKKLCAFSCVALAVLFAVIVYVLTTN